MNLLLALAATCTMMGQYTMCNDGTTVWNNGATISQMKQPNGQITNIYQSGNQLRIVPSQPVAPVQVQDLQSIPILEPFD
jgi:hypothetical protein